MKIESFYEPIGYSPINIGKFLKEGSLKNVKDIHRYYIDSRLEEKKNG